MSALSDYAENKLGDALLRGVALTFPAALYVALFTVAPSDAGGGTEVAGGSYARVQNGPSLTTWKGTHGSTSGPSSGTSGLFKNAVPVTFPAPTGNWGTVVHIGVFDAPTGGNLWLQGPLLPAQAVVNGGAAPSFAVDALALTFA